MATSPQKDMEEPKMHSTKWKKPIGKGSTLYDYSYMAFGKRQILERQQKGQWLPVLGTGKEGYMGEAQGAF